MQQSLQLVGREGRVSCPLHLPHFVLDSRNNRTSNVHHCSWAILHNLSLGVGEPGLQVSARQGHGQEVILLMRARGRPQVFLPHTTFGHVLPPATSSPTSSANAQLPPHNPPP